MFKELLSKLASKLSEWEKELAPKKVAAPVAKPIKRLDFTLLTSKQVLGDSDGYGQLAVFSRYGTGVAPTDLAIILGESVSDDYCTSEGDATCRTYTRSFNGGSCVRCLWYDCDNSDVPPYRRDLGIRPVLPPSETVGLKPIAVKKGIHEVDIVEYGEYPQTLADNQISQELEKRYQSSSLRQTGKEYTFDSTTPRGGNLNFNFIATSHPEYELDGKKYIRMKGLHYEPGKDPYSDHNLLSNGERAEDSKTYWVQVQPIEWLKDPTGTWVSKKCLLTGVQFDRSMDYDGYFSKTFMKRYLDAYFAAEIEPSELTSVKTMKMLKKKLTEISDLEKVKASVKPAHTPERTEELARITRVRRAKTLLSAAAQKAQKDGDEKMLQEIVELAKPFAVREAVVRDKFHQRQAARHAKKSRE